MKDIVAKYKKHTLLQSSLIIITSLAIALGINTYLLDGNIGKYLQSSVLDINGIEQTADIYGRVSENRETIILGTQKPINNLETISLSLVYDVENTTIEKVSSVISGAEVITLSNEPGITTVLVSFSTPQVLLGESDILKLNVEKITKKTQYLNIINANFKDTSGEEYLLSTSGILF